MYRVRRVIEYTGSLDDILRTLKRNFVQPGNPVVIGDLEIKETECSDPEIVEESEVAEETVDYGNKT